MEQVYQSYTKVVQNSTYYFVKKFLVFPELTHVEPVLEGYGMHTNFEKACEIAGIQDETVRKQVFEQLQAPAHQAKVIELKDVPFISQKAANQ